MTLGRLFYAAELNDAPNRPDVVVFDSYASGHFLSLMTTPDALISAGLGGPLVRETQRVRNFLADPQKCGVLYVLTPEELVVTEFRDFLPKLVRQAPAQIVGLVVNRLLSDEALPGQLEKQRIAIQALQIHLDAFRAEFELPLPMLRLPELGFVEEPLAPDFGPSWCEGSVL
jgi:anion-transporting  ArsA/GET3 family ATPase